MTAAVSDPQSAGRGHSFPVSYTIDTFSISDLGFSVTQPWAAAALLHTGNMSAAEPEDINN